jgi:hypothetical protein
LSAYPAPFAFQHFQYVWLLLLEINYKLGKISVFQRHQLRSSFLRILNVAASSSPISPILNGLTFIVVSPLAIDLILVVPTPITTLRIHAVSVGIYFYCVLLLVGRGLMSLLPGTIS